MEESKELYLKTEELARSLKESSVYKNYLEAKDRLMENELLAGRIKEYMRRNFVIQNNESQNKVDSLHDLQNEYRDILRNTVARDFLNAELSLCKTIKKMNSILVEDVDISVDFFDF